jgi:hypothetical protein
MMLRLLVRVGYPQYIWLFRTPKPNERRDTLFYNLKHYVISYNDVNTAAVVSFGVSLIVNLLQGRAARLTEYYYIKFGHPDWDVLWI